MTPKQEARLYGRAIKSRWPVGDDKKLEVVEVLNNIAKDTTAKESARVAACNALLAAEGQNQKDEHKAADLLAQQRAIELDEIADELGIEADIVKRIERESGGNTQGTQG